MNREVKAKPPLSAKLREESDWLASFSGHLTGDDKVRISILLSQAANEIECSTPPENKVSA